MLVPIKQHGNRNQFYPANVEYELVTKGVSSNADIEYTGNENTWKTDLSFWSLAEDFAASCTHNPSV